MGLSRPRQLLVSFTGILVLGGCAFGVLVFMQYSQYTKQESVRFSERLMMVKRAELKSVSHIVESTITEAIEQAQKATVASLERDLDVVASLVKAQHQLDSANQATDKQLLQLLPDLALSEGHYVWVQIFVKNQPEQSVVLLDSRHKEWNGKKSLGTTL
jgi:hypothetical protein